MLKSTAHAVDIDYFYINTQGCRKWQAQEHPPKNWTAQSLLKIRCTRRELLAKVNHT